LRSGALKVLEMLKPEDEVALMTFAGNPRVDLNFVKDKNLAAEAIRVANPDGLMGGTYIGEAVYQAAEYMQRSSNPEGRRIIIAISDDISTVKPPLLHSELETTHKVLESDAMVCELFFDTIYRHRNPSDLNPAVPRVVLVDAQEGIIETYVERTGGIALQADKANIAGRFSLLIQRLRTRYSIGYVSSNQNRDGKFRKIKLRVATDVEGRTGPVAVTTKRGYYAW
jgi:VWFA-related protein